MSAWKTGTYNAEAIKKSFSYTHWGEKTNSWVTGVGKVGKTSMRRWIEILQATRPYTRYVGHAVRDDASDDSDRENSDTVDYRTNAPDSGTGFFFCDRRFLNALQTSNLQSMRIS